MWYEHIKENYPEGTTVGYDPKLINAGNIYYTFKKRIIINYIYKYQKLLKPEQNFLNKVKSNQFQFQRILSIKFGQENHLNHLMR